MAVYTLSVWILFFGKNILFQAANGCEERATSYTVVEWEYREYIHFGNQWWGVVLYKAKTNKPTNKQNKDLVVLFLGKMNTLS